MGSVRPFVLLVPITIFLATTLASLIDLKAFLAFTKALNTWIVTHFSRPIVTAVFGFVLTCLIVVISPLGKVRIGGPEAKPLLSRWNWFAITLCTTLAIGILFWAMAEPLIHLYQPGGRTFAPGGAEAQDFALVSLFMHWSVSPYAIYTVAGLTFALSYHNLGKPYSVSGPFAALTGRPVPPAISSVLDATILVALIMGMAASLGAGVLLLSGGLAEITGQRNGPFLMALVASAIGFLVLLSSLSGLMRGIRILSDWNVRFFFAFAGFIFIFGPSREILIQAGASTLSYVQDFVPRSLFLGEAARDQVWAYDWTIVYFANWLAWAPVTAMFLGRIAKGYTVRMYVLMNLVLPSLFAIVWMSIFGVFALETERATQGALSQVMNTLGIEAVIFEAMKSLPAYSVLVVVLLCLSFVSYVTAADSNTEAIAEICRRHQADDPELQDANLRVASPGLKIVWVLLLVSTAWTMVAYSGVDGVRMLSNVGGLPALFIVIGLQLTLLRFIWQTDRLNSVVPGPA